ncbi:nad-dependent epimerase dehydratase [Fusarium pseudocircinatum]|uniref:Nad-dependent epimerase dehydratase n=1 Tax=Fusarium pseudocircinatum TaxID=56676 RepID=A0A8H5KPD1_9HYPO|nr:nad-dependent epimerase dehydratase [Fusarium pseudocircinatum]
MTEKQGQLTVGVIGPAGFGGSYLCVELINRGHRVVGLSRNPQKLGSHLLYEPRNIDLASESEAELASAFSDVDVLQTPALMALMVQSDLSCAVPFIEVIRKIILAVKRARLGYFIMLGGTGSLHVPHEDGVCAADSKDFFLAYRRAIADSHAHVTYMEERLGPLGVNLRAYRNARLALRGNDEEKKKSASRVISEYEANLREGDAAAEFIKAARTTVMFFDGNRSLNWTYVSPSALYRPGKRTGTYEVTIDNLPLKGETQGENRLDGRLMGISAADLAIAIADEAETRKHIYQHWTATSDLSDDTPAPAYLNLISDS